MRKVFLIGWKDVTLAFRDTAALVFMLAAPFALTLGLGLISGRFSGTGSGGLSNIPVVVVNQDNGQLGSELLSALRSPELGGLLRVVVREDPAQARQLVDADKVAAAVIVPGGFTSSIMPGRPSPPAPLPGAGEGGQITLYANPTRPTLVGVIRTIVDEFVSRVEIGRVGAQVAVTQLAGQGLLKGEDASRLAAEIGARLANGPRGSSVVLRNVTGAGPAKFDVLAYMAPGMALMFLMFTVANGGRTLLSERNQGTLSRLLVSPTAAYQVLGGKVFGTFLTGTAQMLILIVASTLLFRLNWGDPLAVLALVLAAVVGALGWGMLITALAKTPGQVNAVGSAVMLTFGILGGSFISLDNMPRWFATLSKITPNAWGLDGFTTLALGGRLADIRGPIMALLVMGALLFGCAVVIYNRRGLAEA